MILLAIGAASIRWLTEVRKSSTEELLVERVSAAEIIALTLNLQSDTPWHLAPHDLRRTCAKLHSA